MKSSFLRQLCLNVLAFGVVLHAHGHDVVINEIMYHPSSENSAEEYIELWNTGTNSVNMAGWRFTRGVQFTITNSTLAPGNFLVIAASPAAFSAKYSGVPNVIGGWQGTLANGGERVELFDQTGVSVDRVDYADEGNWALRVRWVEDPRGWRWSADHDGLGSSVELVNVALPNQHGQNWASSLVAQGTPGVANSTVTNNTPPLILDLKHSPIIPSSADPVTITAAILDELATGLTVTLFSRLAVNDPPPAFVSAPMFDDGAHGDGAAGDGVFGAILPPRQHGTVVEFYAQARDAAGNSRTYPGAARQADGTTFAQTANALYQVDESVYSGPQPVLRLIMTETERAILASGAIRQSNAEMNGTLISVDGTGTEFRYNIGSRIRGAGSRGAQIPNYRVNIPSDNVWNGVSEINLNAQFGHSQLAGSVLSLKAGIPAANALAVQVRVNTENLANANLPQFGSYVQMEVVNGDWAQNHFPNDPNGNVYSARRPNTDLRYLGTDPNTYINTGYDKSSNSSENDWSDLIQLTDLLNNSTDEAYADTVRQIANPLEWAGYFAIFSLLGSGETSLATGVGDDYNMYRGVEDPRFLLLPHDFDTILSQGQGPAGANTDLFRAATLPVVNRFLRHPEFVPFYFSELKRIAETVLSPRELDPLLDRLLDNYVPTQTIQQMKDYAVNRNAFVLSQIPTNITVVHTLPIVSGYPESGTATVSLNGRANPIHTRSVRVNGTLATWVPWQSAWNIAGVVLEPGMNRVLVQAFDQNGTEIDRTTLDLRYDDGSETAATGTLSANTTWSSAAGPYRVTGNLTVAAGATLTIQPGTTVYFAPGAALTVRGSIQAIGTEVDRIWFIGAPAANINNTWASVVIVDSSLTNRLSYVDLRGGGSVNHTIELTRSILLADHLTFGNTTRTLIELNNASLHVTDSSFPTLVGAEHIHGGPMPANGFVIIERNIFGSTTELNDIIDFTNARRPGPVLQILGNIFTGASDDVLDLDGTDSYIEGNLFMHVRKDNQNAGDTASAISYGQDGGYGPHVVAVRNIFYDVDHVALVKEGGTLDLINNTAVGISIAGVNFSEPERGVLPGAGAFLDGNIFWNPPGWNGTNFQNLHPTNGTVALTVHRSILSPVDFPAGGIGNLTQDPRLQNTDSNSISALTIWNDFALKSGSPARGAGPNGIDMGAIVPAGASISGVPPARTHLIDALLTIGGPGITDYRFSVNGQGFGAPVSVTNELLLPGLLDGDQTVAVIGRNFAGVWQEEAEAASVSWTVDRSFNRLVLNEVLAANRTAHPVGSETPDLIEIHNQGGSQINLSGMGLTDNATNKHKFVFPPGTFLPAGAYLTVVASGDNSILGLKTGFQLRQEGDDLYLYDTLLNGGALIDSIVFGLQIPDLSIGRLADGSWGLTQPTFGVANIAQPVADPSRLRINEWLADGLILFQDDFVELYNPDPLPARIGGMYLTDEPIGNRQRHQIPALSFIPGIGYFAFIADGSSGGGADHLNFRLSANQGVIGLYNTDLSQIDCVYYGPQTTDISLGRRPNGSDNLAFFGLPTQTQPTPGAPNPQGGGGTIVTTTTLALVPMASDWRYENTGTDLGTGWRAPDFDDSSWPSGPALLGVENAALPPPGLNTRFAPYNSLQPTYYFRSQFVLSTNVSGFNLTATTIIDDGAAIYLNGTELFRVRIPPGPVDYNTIANFTPSGDAVLEVFEVPADALVLGTNVLAVEVHQAGLPSSDIVFGMALDATRSVTNIIGVRVMLNEILADNASFPNPDGSTPDSVELYNPSDTVTDLAGMSLTDDVSDPRRWVFPAGSSIAPGGYLIVQFDGTATATTEAGPLLNTGFGLSSSGDAVLLFDTDASGGGLLDSINFGLQIADFSISRIPNGNPNGAWVLALPTREGVNIPAGLASSGSLRINEWMADPVSGDDWFEIYNPNNQPVALGGLHLTDDLNDRTKHPLAPLSFIGSRTNGFRQFLADNNPQNGADHVTFALRAAGESIGIATANGTLIDGITFGPQIQGVSAGRLPDGAAALVSFPETASPGESNFLPLEGVVINEALSHSDPPFEDAIELRNLTDQSIPVGGWYLSDSKGELRKYFIHPSAVLAPRGLMVFYENQFNPEPGRFLSFALSSADGDEVYLSAADSEGNLTGFRTSVNFGPAENGVAFGRYETSVGADFTAMSQRSFGQDNPATLMQFRSGLGRTNPAPKVGPIVVNEIMYHPPDIDGTNDNVLEEFIELRNITGASVPLVNGTNAWRLRDAVDFNFSTGTSIAGGGFLLVVGFDPSTNAAALTAFRNTYGLDSSVPIVGPYNGRLSNSDDSVELRKPDVPQLDGSVPFVDVDRVHYRDAAPWPSAADDGTNRVSIQRTVASAYGNDPVNWHAAAPTPGSANGSALMPVPSILVQPADQQVAPGATVMFSVTDNGAGPVQYQWRRNGKDLPTQTNSALSVLNAQDSNAGDYTVRISNPYGAVLSDAATLSIERAVEIVQQPLNAIVAPGTTATFSVAVRGTLPITYQWRFNGVDLPGQTGPDLRIPNVQPANEGNYSVTLANAFGSAVSTVATLSINQPPIITDQPDTLAVLAGSQVVFGVTVSGSAPLGYQWRFNGLDLPGANSPTLTLNNVQPAAAGDYTVRITNLVGVALSDVATLTVVIPPQVTVVATDPVGAENPLDTATFTLSRTGNPSLPLTVHFGLSGTAVNGTDYQTITSPVLIPAGQPTTTVVLTPINDIEIESAETAILTVSNGVDYIAGNPGSATVRIADDDNQLPTIRISSPTVGTRFPITPTNILVQVAAADTDGSVVRVEFYNWKTNKLGQSTTAPFSFNWVNAQVGVNSITAIATDNLGATNTSAPVVLLVNIPPVVSLTSPGPGQRFAPPANFLVAADASDADGAIARVDFYQNGALIASDTSPPYGVPLAGVEAGVYSFRAVATDDRGMSVASEEVAVRVKVPSSDFADLFSDRGDITGHFNLVPGNNADATFEVVEPSAFASGSRSMWLSWLAPDSGLCVMQTTESEFDPVITVYTSPAQGLPSIGNLVMTAQNDDDSTLESQAVFNAVGGTTYHIRVEGYGAADFGNFSFLQILLSRTPVVLIPPEDQIKGLGQSATFAVILSGNQPLSAQWMFNGVNISGGTLDVQAGGGDGTTIAIATLTIPSVQETDLGEYRVVISSTLGSVTSPPAALVQGFPPSFIEQPQTQTVVQGDTVSFYVVMDGTPPFSYRWRRGATTLEAMGTDTFTIPNVQLSDAGPYRVVVTNSVNFTPGVQSAPGVLTVLADADGDHNPDIWETANGFNPNDGSDGSLDTDGDGMGNDAEYRAGTDPRDPLSLFTVGITLEAGIPTFHFTAVGGKTYSILYQDSLGAPVWTKLTDVPSEPANRPVSIPDPGGGSATRYYQIVTPKQR